jgi:hypothetical protein
VVVEVGYAFFDFYDVEHVFDAVERVRKDILGESEVLFLGGALEKGAVVII